MVNYAIIGFAVFHGNFFAAEASHGDAASRVALASFNLIMVANALTSLLDASRSLGEVAGHAARIGDFVRAMAAAQRPLVSAMHAQAHAPDTSLSHVFSRTGSRRLWQHGVGGRWVRRSHCTPAHRQQMRARLSFRPRAQRPQRRSSRGGLTRLAPARRRCCPCGARQRW